VRIATFNILHGHSLEDHRVDADRLAAAVKQLDPDVLGLQEVDRDQPRSMGADLTAVAAEAMGAVDSRFVASVAGTPGETWTAATGELQPGSAAYGIALLSRHPVVSWRVVRLPTLRGRGPVWFRDSGRVAMVREEPRVAVAAVIEGPRGPMTVVNTHLSFVPFWNTWQLRRLVGSLAGTPQPQVLIGDLNMGPAQAARASGLRALATGLTFPVGTPTRQLDHVLVKGPLRATAPAEAVRLPLSDHRALVVECEPE
jgi:endonuclease/exonuclease/phosphatase family metal-dependent hydrolase